MCGIAGIFLADRSRVIDRRQLERMVSVLSHRGPDEESLYLRGPIGLGNRRLSVIDLAGGRQPIFSEDRSKAVVFNGEIYGFQELRRELQGRGHHFQTLSDTEVIVHAYEEYGRECVHHLRGMFALAIWDDTRQELFLARDRLGIKPLYYAWDGSTFLFASELKAILQVPTVRRDLDPCALDDYLTYNYIPAPKTIFRDIRKLLPGHSLSVTSAGLDERVYWDLVMEPSAPRSQRTCAAELRDLLRQTVALYLVSDVSVGAFLSGGVDSSTVVALMSEAQSEPVATNSIGFAEADFDELAFARLVAQRFQTRARELVLGPCAVKIVDALVSSFDEPFADSSMVPTYHLSRLARERSTVCLSGDGGDEQFAGYTRFAEFQQDAAAHPFSAERAYFDRRTWITAEMKALLYRDGLKRALSGYDPFSVLRTYFDRARKWDPLSRIQYVETKTYLADDLLAKVDRASMTHGLEVRVPLLDSKVVEYAAGIPPAWKVRDGKGKYILKQAFRDVLPSEVLSRPKKGFSLPLAHWLRGPLRCLVEGRVLREDGVLTTLFDIGRVRGWWEEHRRGARDYNRFFWALILLEAWARRFLDEPGQQGLYE